MFSMNMLEDYKIKKDNDYDTMHAHWVSLTGAKVFF